MPYSDWIRVLETSMLIVKLSNDFSFPVIIKTQNMSSLGAEVIRFCRVPILCVIGLKKHGIKLETRP